MWRPEIPAGNGVFDARSLARLYSRVVDGPLRTVSPTTVDRVRHQQVHGPDEVLVDQPTRFGTTFALSSPRQPMLGHGSFGHDGLGGHLAFAHPESGIAVAFLTNRAIPDPTPDCGACSRRWPRPCDQCFAARRRGGDTAAAFACAAGVRLSKRDRVAGGPS